MLNSLFWVVLHRAQPKLLFGCALFRVSSPATIYLEEEVTKNVEFPTDGKFENINFGRYKVCGDNISDATVEQPRSAEDPADRPFTKSSSIPRPWNQTGPSSSFGIRTKRSQNQPYQTFLKRSIPYVSVSRPKFPQYNC